MEHRQPHMNGLRRGRVVVWVVVGVLLVAGSAGVALVGLRPDRPASPLQQQLQGQLATVEEHALLVEAEARLAVLRAELLAERSADELAVHYQALMADLETAYADAAESARTVWVTVSPELERFGAQLRQGESEALATLDRALTTFRNGLVGEQAEP